jgi:hypothetical protein
VPAQEVSWDEGRYAPAHGYALVYGNGNADRRLATSICVHKGAVSAVRRVASSVSDSSA